MAPVHQHDTSANPATVQQAMAAINWPFASPPADAAVGKHIEIHGSTYLAYCKSWAPVWVDPDDEESLDV